MKGRQLEYKFSGSVIVDAADTSPATRLIETIQKSGATVEVKTVKPVRKAKADAAEAPAAE